MSPTISCNSVYKIFGPNANRLLSESNGSVDAKKFQEAGWRALSADQRETPTVAMMQFARANADMKRSSFRGMLASVSIPEDPVIACALKLNRTESCTIDCIEATFLDVLLKG